jgi:hypothetical protein
MFDGDQLPSAGTAERTNRRRKSLKDIKLNFLQSLCA